MTQADGLRGQLANLKSLNFPMFMPVPRRGHERKARVGPATGRVHIHPE